ncbi:MAG: nickel-dependent lactate racemase [Desulfobacterota bacterium]|nr:nickel-dependent lactate racemase [Thermodesulfobacteriota bacterium]MDW8001957.1 nickel-dependent lactate racemase [Deltaproteobacteria bacterium]
MGNVFHINYEDKKLQFVLPSNWNVKVLEGKRSFDSCLDDESEIKRAIDEPIKSKRLEELAKLSSEIAILFDDAQRNTPCHKIIPIVVDRLNRGGIPDERIRLVCAVGTHPVLTDEELKRRVGESLYERFKGRIFSHDPFGEHVFIGRTRRGTPVEISKIVHESDLIVGVGSCMPHPSAGFGGGYKIIMPGVVSYETTERHHMTFLRNRKSTVSLLRGNPFYEEIKDIGEMAGLTFKIDVVLDEAGRLLKAFAGHPYFEHVSASRYSARVHETLVDGLSDVTITSAHPLEVGVQATKALLFAQYVTKRGGVIVWVAPHRKAGSIGPLLEEMKKPHSASEYHKRFICEGIPENLKHLGVSYVMQIVHFKEIAERYKVIHVTEGLGEEDVRRMGFRYARSMDEAIDLAQSMIRKDANVYVIPSGGSILPRVVNL